MLCAHETETSLVKLLGNAKAATNAKVESILKAPAARGKENEREGQIDGTGKRKSQEIIQFDAKDMNILPRV